MTVAAVIAVFLALLWALVLVGGALGPREWAMRCPICHFYIRTPYGARFVVATCPNCGWTQ